MPRSFIEKPCASKQEEFEELIVQAFLEEGIPLRALNNPKMRRALGPEFGCPGISSDRTLRNKIPAIVKKYEDDVKEIVKDQDVSIIYDGCTNVAECVAMVFRTVNDKLEPRHLLGHFAMMGKSLTGADYAKWILDGTHDTHFFAVTVL
jgi:hypothetical protein